MFYDPELHAMCDPVTGAVIPISEGDVLPEDIKRQIQEKKDHDYAKSLSSTSQSESFDEPISRISQPKYNFLDRISTRASTNYRQIEPTNFQGVQVSRVPFQMEESKIQEDFYSFSGSNLEIQGPENVDIDDNMRLARLLQMFEFEIAQETLSAREMGDDFNEKEYKASSFKRQMMTFSTFVLFLQVCMYAYMYMYLNI